MGWAFGLIMGYFGNKYAADGISAPFSIITKGIGTLS